MKVKHKETERYSSRYREKYNAQKSMRGLCVLLK